MIPTKEEVAAFLLAWFRRQVWGLVRFVWWWRFRATRRMRLFVVEVAFVAALKFLCHLHKARLLGRGRALRFVRRLVSRADGRLNDLHESVMPQGPART